MTRDQRRSLWLNRAVADALRAEPDRVLRVARENLQRLQSMHDRGPVTQSWQRWAELLSGPVDEVIRVLTADDAESRELRQNSPFAGVLAARTRHHVLRSFRQYELAGR